MGQSRLRGVLGEERKTTGRAGVWPPTGEKAVNKGGGLPPNTPQNLNVMSGATCWEAQEPAQT